MAKVARRKTTTLSGTFCMWSDQCAKIVLSTTPDSRRQVYKGGYLIQLRQDETSSTKEVRLTGGKQTCFRQ